jgi:hypothetical protein
VCWGNRLNIGVRSAKFHSNDRLPPFCIFRSKPSLIYEGAIGQPKYRRHLFVTCTSLWYSLGENGENRKYRSP